MDKKNKVVKKEGVLTPYVRPLLKIPTGATKFGEDVYALVEKYVNEIAFPKSGHLPKVESLALFIGVDKKTLYNWGKEHTQFKLCLKWIKELQYERLIDDGIYGGKSINGALVKLVLVSNHKLKDEIGVGLSGEVTTKFSDEQIKRIADRISCRGGNDGGKSGKE